MLLTVTPPPSRTFSTSSWTVTVLSTTNWACKAPADRARIRDVLVRMEGRYWFASMTPGLEGRTPRSPQRWMEREGARPERAPSDLWLGHAHRRELLSTVTWPVWGSGSRSTFTS